MNSKRLAVFAASLQWADGVKVVSRGTPRSRTSVTLGMRWSVSLNTTVIELNTAGNTNFNQKTKRCEIYLQTTDGMHATRKRRIEEAIKWYIRKGQMLNVNFILKIEKKDCMSGCHLITANRYHITSAELAIFRHPANPGSSVESL